MASVLRVIDNDNKEFSFYLSREESILKSMLYLHYLNDKNFSTWLLNKKFITHDSMCKDFFSMRWNLPIYEAVIMLLEQTHKEVYVYHPLPKSTN